MKTVVRVKFGSHLYGTDTPLSDLDYKSVYVPNGRDILLQRVKESICSNPAKGEGEKNAPGDIDEESYFLQKYLKLLAEGQTVAIDMLFAPPANLLKTSFLWKRIRANKHLLLTKKSASFVGYCRAQANKYGIKGSRVAAAKEAAKFFEAALKSHQSNTKVSAFSIVLASMTNEHTRIVKQVCNKAGDIGTYFECCNRLVDFNATIKQAYEIFSRIYENYGDRARLAQDNEGIDWKALSHAVRVGHEALQLLNTGTIIFPLENASHLLAIKQARVPYNSVAEEIEQLLIDVEQASDKSTLPEAVNQDFIDDLVSREYWEAAKKEFNHEDEESDY